MSAVSVTVGGVGLAANNQEAGIVDRTTLSYMPRKKDTERFSVRLPARLAKGLREAADRRLHGDVNAAIADAVGDLVYREEVLARGRAEMEQYEEEYGAFTPEETAAAQAAIAELTGREAAELPDEGGEPK
jgi:hypothetical protein